MVPKVVESEDDVKLMNLSLMIIKRRTGYHYDTVKDELNFVVVDSDKAKTYPSNFICKFPERKDGYWSDSVFGRLFPNNKDEVAKKLLLEALEKEQDSKTKLEIKRRLKNLN